MDTQTYIDSLFTGYEETPVLTDFKEELRSNLNDRIYGLVKKGLTEREAFEKATTELGDVSTLADEISLKKKKEVFSEMYMQTRNYMSDKRIALYVLCGVLLAFGIITAVITGFNTTRTSAPLGSLMVFGGISLLGFVFLALTQETATHEGMSVKRALWYVLACGVFVFGLFVFAFTALSPDRSPMVPVATLIPFGLPSAALAVFLVLTEKDRRKPWMRKMADEQMKQGLERFANPLRAERFGLVSGAMWITAVAAFILLTVSKGILLSWTAIVAALVLQMLILAAFSGGKE